MVANTTAMVEDGSEWKQRFITRVTDPEFVAEALEACADTYFRAKAIKAHRDLKGEILAAWCKDRLEPGRAWSNTAVALWTPPVRKPFSGLVMLLTTAGAVTICVYLLYICKIPGDVTIPVIRSPIEVILEQW